MRLELTLVLLTALIFSPECQAQIDVPQIEDLGKDTLVNMCYTFMGWFLKFKGTGFQEEFGDAWDAAPTFEGAFGVGVDGQLYEYGLATADDKKESWWAYEFTSPQDIIYIDSLITGDPYFIDSSDNAWIVLGGGDPLELGDGSECISAFHSNVLFQIAGIDCNGVLVEFNLETFLDGWTEVDSANAPAVEFYSVSVDTNGNIWATTTTGVVYTYTAAGDWVQMVLDDEYTCNDVSVTLEGSVWVRCENKKGELEIGQLQVIKDKIILFNAAGDYVTAFDILLAATVEESEVELSDIFGIHKKITNLLLPYVEQYASDLLDTVIDENSTS